MRAVTRVASSLLFAFAVSGCDFVGTVSEVQSQANAAASALEKDLGVRPKVGWNWNNGTLTNVNFVFDGRKVGNLQVSQLKAKVEEAVAASFKQKPSNIMVSISWSE